MLANSIWGQSTSWIGYFNMFGRKVYVNFIAYWIEWEVSHTKFWIKPLRFWTPHLCTFKFVCSKDIQYEQEAVHNVVLTFNFLCVLFTVYRYIHSYLHLCAITLHAITITCIKYAITFVYVYSCVQQGDWIWTRNYQQSSDCIDKS